MIVDQIQDGDFLKVTNLGDARAGAAEGHRVVCPPGTDHFGIAQNVGGESLMGKSLGLWFDLAGDDGGMIGFVADDPTIRIELLERAGR